VSAGAPSRVQPEAGGLEQLRELLREQGGLLATLLCEQDGGAGGAGADGADRAGAGAGAQDAAAAAPGRATPAELAAAGPRVAAHRDEYELLIEAIYEGYLLHYGEPRIVRVPEADLGLLAGDQLYAIGLARLVRLGDTLAVAELADTITLCALAHGAGDEELAGAVWEAGARAVGWGPSEAHERAKQLLRDGSAGAFEAMRTSAGGLPAVR
jgi:hypothetical protein